MPRYIDAEKLKDYIKQYWGLPGLMMVSVLHDVDIIPTADVQEVKHGKWMVSGTFDDFLKCSICGFDCVMFVASVFNYCPICGAKMDDGGFKGGNR